MAEAHREILDFMFANLDLNEDIEVSSDLFIDEENNELVFQEDDMFCLDEEIEGIKEIPKVVFVDEDNIQREEAKKLKCPFLTDWGQKDRVPLHLINMFVQSAIKYINDKRI